MSRRSTVKCWFASALALFALAGTPGAARAHQSSLTYASLEVSDDHRQIRYEIRLDSRDLYEALGLPTHREASAEEIRSGAAKLQAYVWKRIELESNRDDCKTVFGSVRVLDSTPRFALLDRELHCPGPVSAIALDYTLFYDLDPRHLGLVRLDGELVELSYPEHNRLEYEIGVPPHSSRFAFLRSGVEHIIFGLDHILFLLSLLLAVGLARGPSGLRQRAFRETLRTTAAIVTSFTAAHSLTLAAAAMGWLSLPAALVESGIALSVIYVAGENVVRPDPPKRYLLTFAFGLLHGLGFASMLEPLLPPKDVAWALLFFNVGVEMGQLVIVAVALPLFAFALARLGAARYHRSVVWASSLLLMALGLCWFLERALHLRLVSGS